VLGWLADWTASFVGVRSLYSVRIGLRHSVEEETRQGMERRYKCHGVVTKYAITPYARELDRQRSLRLKFPFRMSGPGADRDALVAAAAALHRKAFQLPYQGPSPGLYLYDAQRPSTPIVAYMEWHEDYDEVQAGLEGRVVRPDDGNAPVPVGTGDDPTAVAASASSDGGLSAEAEMTGSLALRARRNKAAGAVTHLLGSAFDARTSANAKANSGNGVGTELHTATEMVDQTSPGSDTLAMRSEDATNGTDGPDAEMEPLETDGVRLALEDAQPSPPSMASLSIVERSASKAQSILAASMGDVLSAWTRVLDNSAESAESWWALLHPARGITLPPLVPTGTVPTKEGLAALEKQALWAQFVASTRGSCDSSVWLIADMLQIGPVPALQLPARTDRGLPFGVARPLCLSGFTQSQLTGTPAPSTVPHRAKAVYAACTSSAGALLCAGIDVFVVLIPDRELALAVRNSNSSNSSSSSGGGEERAGSSSKVAQPHGFPVQPGAAASDATGVRAVFERQVLSTLTCLRCEYEADRSTLQALAQGAAPLRGLPTAVASLSSKEARKALADIEAQLARLPRRIGFVYFPIEDEHVPPAAAASTLCDELAGLLRHGHKVHVASTTGRGRAAALSTVLLGRMYGLPAEESLHRVQRAFAAAEKLVPRSVPSGAAVMSATGASGRGPRMDVRDFRSPEAWVDSNAVVERSGPHSVAGSEWDSSALLPAAAPAQGTSRSSGGTAKPGEQRVADGLSDAERRFLRLQQAKNGKAVGGDENAAATGTGAATTGRRAPKPAPASSPDDPETSSLLEEIRQRQALAREPEKRTLLPHISAPTPESVARSASLSEGFHVPVSFAQVSFIRNMLKREDARYPTYTTDMPELRVARTLVVERGVGQPAIRPPVDSSLAALGTQIEDRRFLRKSDRRTLENAGKALTNVAHSQYSPNPALPMYSADGRSPFVLPSRLQLLGVPLSQPTSAHQSTGSSALQFAPERIDTLVPPDVVQQALSGASSNRKLPLLQ
jgi:hypothetical protein